MVESVGRVSGKYREARVPRAGQHAHCPQPAANWCVRRCRAPRSMLAPVSPGPAAAPGANCCTPGMPPEAWDVSARLRRGRAPRAVPNVETSSAKPDQLMLHGGYARCTRLAHMRAARPLLRSGAALRLGPRPKLSHDVPPVRRLAAGARRPETVFGQRREQHSQQVAEAGDRHAAIKLLPEAQQHGALPQFRHAGTAPPPPPAVHPPLWDPDPGGCPA